MGLTQIAEESVKGGRLGAGTEGGGTCLPQEGMLARSGGTAPEKLSVAVGRLVGTGCPNSFESAELV